MWAVSSFYWLLSKSNWNSFSPNCTQSGKSIQFCRNQCLGRGTGERHLSVSSVSCTGTLLLTCIPRTPVCSARPPVLQPSTMLHLHYNEMKVDAIVCTSTK